jgi:YggT family protein
MDIILVPLLAVLSSLIGIYTWVVIASVILSWLVNFNIINSRNNFIRMLREFLFRTTEPVLNIIRRFLPIIGGFDLSPLVLIIFLWFLQAILGRLILRIFA